MLSSSLGKGGSREPNLAGDISKSALFSEKPIQELEVFKQWSLRRSLEVERGAITETTFKNESRTVRRFLDYIKKLGENWPEIPTDLVSATDRQRLGCSFIEQPWAKPLPLVSAFFSSLTSKSQISSAKAIIKNFLLIANPDFNSDLLDYLTQSKRNSRHPLVEAWLASYDHDSGGYINYRHRTRRFLDFVAKKYLDTPFHTLDMQAELEAVDALKRGEQLTPNQNKQTLTGILLLNRDKLASQFFESLPKYDDKHHRSTISLFLASLENNQDRKVSTLPQEPIRLPAVPTANKKSVDSPVAASAPTKATKKTPTRPASKANSFNATPTANTSASARMEKEFINEVQSHQQKAAYSHLGLGFETELAVCMRDVLLKKLVAAGFSTDELSQVRCNDVILKGRDLGLYVINPSKQGEYSKNGLSEELIGALNVYTKTIRKLPALRSYFASDNENPPLLFILQERSAIGPTAKDLATIIEDLT